MLYFVTSMIKKASLPAQTFLAMILGALVGYFFGPRLSFLGEFSRVLISVIKTISIPLLFLAINEGFLRSEFRGKGFIYLLFFSFFNACCAIFIALGISNIFHPGQWLSLNLPSHSSISGTQAWLAHLSEKLSLGGAQSLITGTTLIIFVSLGTGVLTLILRKTFFRKKAVFFEKYAQALSQGLHLLFKVIDKIVLLLPLAVFCSMVKAVGLQGFSVAKGLLAYFLACGVGMVLHILITYQSWIFWYGGISLKKFWKIALEPALYAFGMNSSLATLPVTLRALEKLKISPSASRLSACVGTNFNNDGILLYEVVAALFLIQAYGLHLPLSSQLLVALISVVACIGVAGIPEAGIISLTIVLSSIGLPAEAIPFLLTVDWVLARMRSFTNVLGDMTVAILIDRATLKEKS